MARRTDINRIAYAGFVALACFACSPSAVAKTELVMLGTGTPVPDGDRAGASLAVIYNGEAYVFDAGGGMVQRAIQASQQKGVKALYPTNIKHLFLTHLHSDHVLDFSELAATLWWRRTVQLTAHGPVGLKELTAGYYDMLAIDTKLRTSGNQPIKHPTFYQVLVNEYPEGGWVFRDGEVTVEAFDVPHGSIKPAFGYKITTPDKTIVYSGDTSYSEKLIEMAKGADILVHEVISEQGWSKLPPVWQAYHAAAHTRTSQLAEIANKARPGLLVLTHILYYSAPIESVLTEIQATYDGKIVLPDDLDIF